MIQCPHMGTYCHFRYQNSRKVSILPGTRLPFQKSVPPRDLLLPSSPTQTSLLGNQNNTWCSHWGTWMSSIFVFFDSLKHILMESHDMQLATSCRAGTDTCQFPRAASRLPSRSCALALMLPSPPNSKRKNTLKNISKTWLQSLTEHILPCSCNQMFSHQLKVYWQRKRIFSSPCPSKASSLLHVPYRHVSKRQRHRR